MVRTHPLAASRTVTRLGEEAEYLELHLREVDLDLLVGSSVHQWPAAVGATGEGNLDRLLDLLLRRWLAVDELALAGTTAWAFGMGLFLISGEGGRLAAATA